MVFLCKIWLVYGAWCACCGWMLSAIGQLNSVAYAFTAAISLSVCAIFLLRSRPALPRFHIHRFFHPLPLIYLLLLAGSLIGGLLYPPNNYDMLTYRLPRMLNWLADGRWHWIHGYIDRMNYGGCGWEWMALPLLLLTRGTALLFLINIISYLLLPGLFFALLRNLGVSGRMAWMWMWLLPTGLTFAMQAGGGANDSVSTVYLLAALFFAFRARRSHKAADVFWSILAAALMTGCKASNVPLLLPCAVVLRPALPILRRRLPATAVVLAIALLASLLPTLILNFTYTRDFTGAPQDVDQLKIHNPVAGVVGNALQLVVGNLEPPVMPLAGKWNSLSKHLLPGSIDRLLERDFPRFSLHMNELPQEEQSGAGLGLTGMAVISLVAMLLAKRRLASGSELAPSSVSEPGRVGPVFRAFGTTGATRPGSVARPGSVGLRNGTWPIILSGWIALLVLMALLGSEAIARLASPYYVFGIAAVLLHPINRTLARQGWWQACALLVGLSVIPALILTPSRPLFPAVGLTAALAEKHPNSQAIQRAALVYLVYSQRADNLAPLWKYLPADQHVIGILGDDDTSETALWKPFFTRRVCEVTPDDTLESIRSRNIRFVVVSADGLADQNSSMEAFLAKFGGKIVGQEAITLKVTEGPAPWFVVDLGV